MAGSRWAFFPEMVAYWKNLSVKERKENKAKKKMEWIQLRKTVDTNSTQISARLVAAVNAAAATVANAAAVQATAPVPARHQVLLFSPLIYFRCSILGVG